MITQKEKFVKKAKKLKNYLKYVLFFWNKCNIMDIIGRESDFFSINEYFFTHFECLKSAFFGRCKQVGNVRKAYFGNNLTA